MRRLLCGVFFLSGAGALAFENLWFRQAGLAFGNSIWASSLVLASFMAGLALGNGAAARLGGRFARPVRLYAGLEITVGLLGLLLVMSLPAVGGMLAPLVRGLGASPAATAAVRFGASFLLLVVPTTAMGLSLPILARALSRTRLPFGEAVGSLYGWNTVGAMAGALAVEAVLVPRLGIRGAAVAACLTCGLAAVLALHASRRFEADPEMRAEAPAGPLAMPAEARRVLIAAFLTGGALLALEVIWFRLLSLICAGTSLTFALLLAVVLLGIGLGALGATVWLRRRPEAHLSLGRLLYLGGPLVVVPYWSLAAILDRGSTAFFFDPVSIAGLALLLILPLSFLSGVVFTFLAASLQTRIPEEAAAAGAVTMFNTLGAMLGALAGGFLLLPLLGIEKSLAFLAGLYGIAALVLPGRAPRPPARFRVLGPALPAAFLASLLLFPFGLMERTFLRLPLRQYPGQNPKIVAVREGVTETAMYVQYREDDEPIYERLVTNGFLMSTTAWYSRRYMGLYIWLPAALHPRLERALLVSYGVGNTARSLVRTREVEAIDVVDISPDILALSSVVHPDPKDDPLRDPRVRVHVEDGRAFLGLTENRYDLITSEPPPPRNAGVVNLYSQEYFALIRSRLREGGMVSYWLPVHDLLLRESQAIVAAFCGVFPDCSLWSGSDLDWMLLGTRNAEGTKSEERLGWQWDDPAVGADLRAAGVESPEQLGALFLLDHRGLADFARGVLPLTDNWPGRIGLTAGLIDTAPYLGILDAAKARAAFETSPLVERLWPAEARARTLETFAWQSFEYDLSRVTYAGYRIPRERRHELITRSRVKIFVQLLLGSDPDRERAARGKAARGEDSAFVRAHLAVAHFAERDFASAAALAGRARELQDTVALRFLHAYSLCLAGRVAEGLALARPLEARTREFLDATFGSSTP